MTCRGLGDLARGAKGSGGAALLARLVTAGLGDVRIWDLSAGKLGPPSAVFRGDDGECKLIVVSPDSRWFATVNAWGPTWERNWTVRRWDLPTQDPDLLRSNPSIISVGKSMSVSRDGKVTTVGMGDNAIRLWDLTAKDASGTLQDPPVKLMELSVDALGKRITLWEVRISPDGRWLLSLDSVSANSKEAHLWDLLAQDPASSAMSLKGHQHSIRSVAFSPEARWAVTASKDVVRLWDLSGDDPSASPLELAKQADGFAPRSASSAISRDGRWVAMHTGKALRLWDLLREDLATPVTELRWRASEFDTLAVTPDGRWLAASCYTGTTAQLFDLSAKDPGASAVYLHGHKGKVEVAVTPDGRWLVTKCPALVQLWDLTAQDPIASPVVLRAHDGMMLSFAISADSKWLVTGPPARLWDITAKDPSTSSVLLRGTALLRLSSATAGPVGFSHDGRWVITGGRDGPRLWHLQVDALVEEARQITGRQLTTEERRQYYLPEDQLSRNQGQEAAIVEIRKLGGRVAVDEGRPDRPVIAVVLHPPNVTDAGLEHVKGLTSLQTLDLRHTQVTDAGLEHLKGLTSLQRLDLSQTQVTDEGVKKLQQVLPTCAIKH